MSDKTDETIKTTAGVADPPAACATGPLIPTGNEALRVGDRGGRHKPVHTPLQAVAAAFAPNRAVSAATMRGIIVAEVVIALLVWLNSPFKVLPRPGEVIRALQSLWMT